MFWNAYAVDQAGIVMNGIVCVVHVANPFGHDVVFSAAFEGLEDRGSTEGLVLRLAASVPRQVGANEVVLLGRIANATLSKEKKVDSFDSSREEEDEGNKDRRGHGGTFQVILNATYFCRKGQRQN